MPGHFIPIGLLITKYKLIQRAAAAFLFEQSRFDIVRNRQLVERHVERYIHQLIEGGEHPHHICFRRRNGKIADIL